MMSVRKFYILLAIACLGGMAGLAFIFRDALGRKIFEQAFNQSTQPFFSKSIQIRRFHLSPKGGLQFGNIEGNLQTSSGPLAWEIRELVSDDPLVKYFSKDGMTVRFEGVKPGASTSLGVAGKIRVKGGKKGFYHLEGVIGGLGLEEMRWLDPENLKGATGAMKGNISIHQDVEGEPKFSAEVDIKEPGGQIAARLFDLLLPYLPQMAATVRQQRQAKPQETVNYQNAQLKIEMNQLDQMKVFLHMSVPDYNLILNLNIEVRIDEKNGFSRLAQLMGLVKEKN